MSPLFLLRVHPPRQCCGYHCCFVNALFIAFVTVKFAKVKKWRALVQLEQLAACAAKRNGKSKKRAKAKHNNTNWQRWRSTDGALTILQGHWPPSHCAAVRNTSVCDQFEFVFLCVFSRSLRSFISQIEICSSLESFFSLFIVNEMEVLPRLLIEALKNARHSLPPNEEGGKELKMYTTCLPLYCGQCCENKIESKSERGGGNFPTLQHFDPRNVLCIDCAPHTF